MGPVHTCAPQPGRNAQLYRGEGEVGEGGEAIRPPPPPPPWPLYRGRTP